MLTLIQNDPEVPPGLVATLLTERGVPFRLVRLDLGAALPQTQAVTAAIVLGGRMGVGEVEHYPFLHPLKTWLQQLLQQRTAVLGICLGGQLLAEVAGGTVSTGRCGERGLCAVTLTAVGTRDPLLAGMAPVATVMQWHDDSFTLPPAAQHLAASTCCPVQAFRIANAWGVQFHPEVDRTIVTSWCRDSGDAGEVLQQFLLVEADHVALGRHLLTNFLVECEASYG